MKASAFLLLFVLAAWPNEASAQQADSVLTNVQLRGRQLFAQSCGICHLPPEAGTKTFGPPLNKAAGGGDDELMREYILNGTPRMPSFKAYLKPADIDAIIAYVRTVPVATAPPAPAAR